VFRALDVSHRIRNSLFSPLIKLAEKYVYANCDLLSANNEAMAEYCKRLSGRTGPTEVHYPPLDLNHFRLAKRDLRLASNLGINVGDRVISYLGSFFYFSGLEIAIKEFAGSSRANQKLLLIGGGEQERGLRELTQKLGVSDRVIFTGFISYSELPNYLALSDVAINTLEPSLVANCALPNKVLQYVASGLKVVSTELAGLKSIFGDSPAVEWASSPRRVMARALEISISTKSISPSSLACEKILARFDPETAVEMFEAALINQVKGKEK
jgi:glycosyltransferase involved in cell wall biosynthesis